MARMKMGSVLRTCVGIRGGSLYINYQHDIFCFVEGMRFVWMGWNGSGRRKEVVDVRWEITIGLPLKQDFAVLGRWDQILGGP